MYPKAFLSTKRKCPEIESNSITRERKQKMIRHSMSWYRLRAVNLPPGCMRIPKLCQDKIFSFLDWFDMSNFGSSCRWMWSLMKCAATCEDGRPKMPGIEVWMQRRWKQATKWLLRPYMRGSHPTVSRAITQLETSKAFDYDSSITMLHEISKCTRSVQIKLKGDELLRWLAQTVALNIGIESVHLYSFNGSDLDSCCQISYSTFGASVFHKGGFMLFINQRKPTVTFYDEHENKSIQDLEELDRFEYVDAWTQWVSGGEFQVDEPAALFPPLRLKRA
jgi:hypothetical protein